MSAFGPKRTLLFAPQMSAFGSKADMTIALQNVCAAERQQHDLAVAARLVTGGSLNFGPGRELKRRGIEPETSDESP